MSRKNEKCQIGKNLYSVTQMDAIKALKVQLYLTKLLAPVFNSQESFLNNLASALPKILENVEDEKFVNFFVEICELANVKTENSNEYKNINYNMHFEGGHKLKEAYEVFLFVLKVNYADFIQGVFGVDVSKILAKTP